MSYIVDFIIWMRTFVAVNIAPSVRPSVCFQPRQLPAVWTLASGIFRHIHAGRKIVRLEILKGFEKGLGVFIKCTSASNLWSVIHCKLKFHVQRLCIHDAVQRSRGTMSLSCPILDIERVDVWNQDGRLYIPLVCLSWTILLAYSSVQIYYPIVF